MLKTGLTLLSVVFLASACATTATTLTRVDGPKPMAKPQISASEQQNWKLMVGRWYGDHPLKDGGRKEWIVTRLVDGTYRIDFVQTGADGKVKKGSEAGHWAVSGPVYFSSFRGRIEGDKFYPADPSNPSNYDAYRIIRLDEEAFEYEYFTTGDQFSVRRVSPSFEIPQ